MGLYDAVRREEKPRRRWHPMWVVALAFAAALVTAHWTRKPRALSAMARCVQRTQWRATRAATARSAVVVLLRFLLLRQRRQGRARSRLGSTRLRCG